jgi:hypothetical protein
MDTIEDKIKDFFKEDEENLKSLFLQIFTHICNTEFGNKDIYVLGKILSFNQLKKLSEYYDGDTLKIPSMKEFNEIYFLSLCYFLKEEVGWDWKKIKEVLGVNNDDEFFSTISLGKRILTIKETMKKDLRFMLDSLTKESKENVPDFIEEVKKWIPKQNKAQ